MSSLTRVLAGIAIAQVILAGSSELVSAEHDSFRYKWPYLPGAGVLVTGYPFTEHHGCPTGPGRSCTDAWDLVISGGDVRSAAEGTAYEVVSSINPGTCNPADGLGNNVKVSVPDEPDDRSIFYAHLASTPVIQGNRILQGDYVGLQGHTGHTEGNESGGCGTHLHFEFANPPGHPSVIDGQSIPGNVTDPGPSTNVVGAFNVPGGAIRQEYFDLGSAFTSWATVGWTADSTSGHAGCGAVPLCRLFVHYQPDPVEGHLGSRQDFRLHPDASGLQYQSIMTGRWANSTAYLVERPFFASWLFGATLPSGAQQSIGPPLIPRTDNFPLWCESSDGCVQYQRFHTGYIWRHATGGMQAAVFCPDVGARLSYTVRIDDVLATVGAFGNDDPGAPYDSWAGARLDINGNGQVRVDDILGVVNAFGRDCFP